MSSLLPSQTLERLAECLEGLTALLADNGRVSDAQLRILLAGVDLD